MPNIIGSSYQKPTLLFNSHLETILPSAIRRFKNMPDKESIEIDTPDDDFIQIDKYINRSRNAVIISHGLEGDSERPYVLGMVRRFVRMGWDVFAWNFRSCGGKMNRTAKMYHSGATEDLYTVVQYVDQRGYENISMIGFSLGANLTLKFLGEYDLKGVINSSVVFSAPLDLADCSTQIDSPRNSFYAKRFLDSLTKKVIEKRKMMPDILPHLESIKFESLYQFDDLVTAPLHGFNSADHYYTVNSSRYFIDKIEIPTLVVNAQNDPFLAPSCLDPSYFESSKHVYFEIPKFGGHVGFSSFGQQNVFWSEERALRFITLQSISYD